MNIRAEADEPRPLHRSTALIFVERRQAPRSLPQAPAEFIAHLIACNARMGEYRRARRQSAATGTDRYGTPARPAAPPSFETEA